MKRKVEPTTSQVITSSFHNIVTKMPGHRWPKYMFENIAEKYVNYCICQWCVMPLHIMIMKTYCVHQEPSPAKMAATEPSFSVMKSGDPRLWQGERPSGGPDVAPVWTVTDTDPLGLDETPAGVEAGNQPTHIHTHSDRLSSLSDIQSHFLPSNTVLTSCRWSCIQDEKVGLY